MRELGALDGVLYALDRALQSLSAGRARLYRYTLVAQPVPSAPLLGPRRGRAIEVRPMTADDPALAALPLDAAVLRHRFAQDGVVCFGAFQDGEVIGCLWLCLGPFLEDEVRCRFIPRPAGAAAWDFDVYIHPERRAGLAFARLWDGANDYLRVRGIAWSFSRISLFNPGSLAAHARLGARRVASATFLRLGAWQVMVAGPPLRLAAGWRRVPEVPLLPPRGDG
ncbi:MAG: GNAT family N-acetyltransferase [Alphaproteobacteria bacterium]|nr:MAG: GNAT family N-acetyltransferase [Alphaproteobacteria bacterium]